MDIAIIELENNLNFNERIQPIQLPEPNEIIPNYTMMNLTGWGETVDSIETEILQFLNIPIVDHNECVEDYRNYTADKPELDMFVKNWEICAGFIGIENQNACYGDSGGPLTANNIIYGIVSWGTKICALPDLPAVYTSVSYFRNWINEKTGL